MENSPDEETPYATEALPLTWTVQEDLSMKPGRQRVQGYRAGQRGPRRVHLQCLQKPHSWSLS